MAVRRRTITAPRPPEQCTPQIAVSDAIRIAQHKGMPAAPYFDPELLAENLGIEIEYLPLEETTSGYLRSRAGRWTIGINALHHPNRQRFTIAHELGHYFLHRNQGDFEDKLLFRRHGNYNADERDANNFAASLLMNQQEIQRLHLAGTPLSVIAKAFKVSQDAAKFRLVELGLLANDI